MRRSPGLLTVQRPWRSESSPKFWPTGVADWLQSRQSPMRALVRRAVPEEMKMWSESLDNADDPTASSDVGRISRSKEVS